MRGLDSRAGYPEIVYKGITSGGPYDLIEGHCHPDLDNTGLPVNMLLAAKWLHINTIFMTGHDSVEGYKKTVALNNKLGLGINIQPGIESSIRADDGRNSMHILGYGIDPDNPPPPHLSLPEFNEIVHEQGGITIAAHPGLADISMSMEEIEASLRETDQRKRLDGLEVMSGSAALTDRMVARYPWLLEQLGNHGFRLVGGTNAAAQDFMKELGPNAHLEGRRERVIFTGASDIHRALDMGTTIMRKRRGVDALTALKSGEIDIVSMRPQRLSLVNIAVGTVRGEIMKRKRGAQTN